MSKGDERWLRDRAEELGWTVRVASNNRLELTHPRYGTVRCGQYMRDWRARDNVLARMRRLKRKYDAEHL